MKIIPPAAQDVAVVNARSTPNHAMQWRKALEEAQWQARQQIARRDQGEPAARQTANDSSAQGNNPAHSCEPPVMSMPESASAQLPSRIDALAAAIASTARDVFPASPTSEQRLPTATVASQRPMTTDAPGVRSAELERAA